MLSPWDLKNCKEAGEAIADAIWKQKNIVIIGDYDCDGATAVPSVFWDCRRSAPSMSLYLIPDRDKDGYGLSPQLVDRAAAGAEFISTVDNGISSVAAVEHAKSPWHRGRCHRSPLARR